MGVVSDSNGELVTAQVKRSQSVSQKVRPVLIYEHVFDCFFPFGERIMKLDSIVLFPK